MRAAQTSIHLGFRHPFMETVQNTHCALVGCNTVDFLPIICPLCTLSFCKEHSFEDNHFCSRSAVQPGATGDDIGNSRISCSLPGCSDPTLAFKSQPDRSRLACPSCNLFFCTKYELLSTRIATTLTDHIDIVMEPRIDAPNWQLRLIKQAPKRRLGLQRFSKTYRRASLPHSLMIQ
jgi:hypothetical protein